MTGLLSISVAQDGPAEVVAVSGEVDLSNCEELADAITNLNGAHAVVVDLTLCTFFDSSCLGVLVRYANQAAEAGTSFAVRANEHGRKVIELTNLTEKLGVAP